MKIFITLMALALILQVASAMEPASQLPQDPTIAKFDWNTAPIANNPAFKSDQEKSTGDAELQSLRFTYSSTQTQNFRLVSITLNETPKPGPHTYVIEGDVLCEEDAWPGSFIELWTYDDSIPMGGNFASGGPLVDFVNSPEWQHFRFETGKLEHKVYGIEIHLYLAGPCTLHFRNFKAIEVPVTSASAFDSQTISEYSWHNSDDILTRTGRGSSLWVIDYPKITTPYFAVVGEVRYENVSNLSLTLYANFLPDRPGASPISLRTQDDSGLLAKIDGTSGWRPFALRFDLSARKDRLTSLVLNLEGSGGDKYGIVYFRNLKLVQYSDGNFPFVAASTGKIPPVELVSVAPQVTANSRVDWISFALGIAVSILAVAFAGASSFFLWRLNRRRHDREMRRIASLDT